MSTSETPDSSQFYELYDPLATRPLRLSVLKYSDWVTSDILWELFKGRLFPKQPLKLGIHSGGQLSHFLWSSFPPMVCISTFVVGLFHYKGVTGWSTYPVEVYGRKGEPLPGYHGFAVTGSECRRDRSRSQIITKHAVPGGEPFEVYIGLYFHEDDWDGSDIFRVSSFGGTIVTEKVKKILKQAKVTNVRLTPLHEIERDVLLDKYDHDILGLRNSANK
jgi:hypothetical protein